MLLNVSGLSTKPKIQEVNALVWCQVGHGSRHLRAEEEMFHPRDYKIESRWPKVVCSMSWHYSRLGFPSGQEQVELEPARSRQWPMSNDTQIRVLSLNCWCVVVCW